jgi:cytochrome c553
MSACKQMAALICIIATVLLLLPTLLVSAAALEEKLAACLACHGATGQAVIPEVPSLGGQPVVFLTIQLLMFRDKLRVVEPMNQAMQGLTDDDLRNIVVYLAKLPPPNPLAARSNKSERSAPARSSSNTAVISAIKEIFPATKMSSGSPASAKTTSPKPCANTRTTRGAATTPRWRMCSIRSAMSR